MLICYAFSFVYLWIYFAGYVAWVRTNSDEVIHVNTYTKGGQKKKMQQFMNNWAEVFIVSQFLNLLCIVWANIFLSITLTCLFYYVGKI